MGAPKKGAGSPSGGLQLASNYSGNGYNAEYTHKHLAFDQRRFGVAASHTRADVWQACGLAMT